MDVAGQTQKSVSQPDQILESGMAAVQTGEANPQPEFRSVEEAFLALEAPLLTYALRLLKDPDMAQDIVQEAFLRFHREAGKGTAIDSSKAYLSAITTRLSIDHLLGPVTGPAHRRGSGHPS